MDLNPEHMAGEALEGGADVIGLIGQAVNKLGAEIDRLAAEIDKLASKLEGDSAPTQ